MSDACEHPFCTRAVAQKCPHHCQLDLCEEHAVEHKNLFLAQYEKSFSKLTKSLQELLASIETKKTKVKHDYQHELSSIHDAYQTKCRQVDEKAQIIASTQTLVQRKVQLLADAKLDPTLLHQYDVEQVKLYWNKIKVYPVEETVKSSGRPSAIDVKPQYESMKRMKPMPSNDDKTYYPGQNDKSNRKTPLQYRGFCPLNRYGIYGLQQEHHSRLCSHTPSQGDRNLYGHFYSYHRLSSSMSYRLAKAIMHGMDPLTTNIVLPEEKSVIKQDEIIECPLDKVHLAPCKKRFMRQSLKTHLLSVHQLTVETSNRIVDTYKVQGNLSGLEVDIDEFN